MKRKDERLDQRLGDFAPLRRPINEIQLERLLDRYGLALVWDYPQILFEHRDQMQLPGWWYRGLDREYEGSRYAFSACSRHHRAVAPLSGPSGTNTPAPTDLLARLGEAYRVLDEIFSPAPKAADYPRAARRQGYCTTGRRGYA